jgi:hypothetical protein
MSEEWKISWRPPPRLARLPPALTKALLGLTTCPDTLAHCPLSPQGPRQSQTKHVHPMWLPLSYGNTLWNLSNISHCCKNTRYSIWVWVEQRDLIKLVLWQNYYYYWQTFKLIWILDASNLTFNIQLFIYLFW